MFPYWVFSYYLSTTVVIVPRAFSVYWFGSLYLFAYLLLISNWKRIISILLRQPWAVLLITYAVLSSFWSVAPSITIASSRSLIIQYILAISCVLLYTPSEIIKVITRVLAFSAVMSLLYVFFLPNVGTRGDTLRGIFNHQSALSLSMSMGIIGLLNQFLLNRKSGKGVLSGAITLALCSICTYLLVFCGAKTALGAFFASLIVVPLYFLKQIRGLRSRTLSLFALTYFFILGSSFLYVIHEYIIVDILGKTTDFTGRTVTWEFIMSKFSERPFLGYGMDAFWQNPDIAKAFAALVERRIPSVYNSHSSYYDMLISLGLLGSLLGLVLIVRVTYQNFVLVTQHQSLTALWSLQIIVILLVAGFSDVAPGMLNSRNIGWLVFCIISIISADQYKKLAANRLSIDSRFNTASSV